MNKKLSLILVCCLIIGMMTGCSTETDVVKNEDKPQETAQDIEQEEEIEEVETESRGIIGSHYINPRMGLEERGFPEKGLDESESMQCQTYENTMTDDSTGIQYNCSLFIEDDSTIISATFDTLNLEGLDTENFIKNVTSYLKYCVSLPYDSMDIDKVYSWIDENINEVGSGDDGATIVIGDAEFSLYGTEVDSGIAGTRILQIQKATKDE